VVAYAVPGESPLGRVRHTVRHGQTSGRHPAEAIGERVLLPAVRRADPDTLIVADGFSCREQISQCTGRQALHLAELLQMAMRQERSPQTATISVAV